MSIDSLTHSIPRSADPRRIAIFSAVPAEGWSGGRYHAWMLAHCASLAGHEVHIVANNHPVFEPEFRRWPGTQQPVLHSTTSYRDNLPDGDFDLTFLVPHRNTGPGLYAAARSFASERAARRAMINFESGNWFNAVSPTKRPLREWNQWIEFTDRHCTVLSSAHESDRWARDFYTKYPATTRFDIWHPAINEPESRQHTLRPTRPTLAVITRFDDAHKGANELASLLPPTMTGWALAIIVGKAPPAGILKRIEAAAAAVGMTVRLHIQATDAEKFAVLRAADALLFPSRFEGFGYPPVEAAFVGTPAVAYDLPVLREMLGDAALYAPSGDTTALRAALSRVATGTWTPSQESTSQIQDRMALPARVAAIDDVIQSAVAGPELQGPRLPRRLGWPGLRLPWKRSPIRISEVTQSPDGLHIRGWIRSRQQVDHLAAIAEDGTTAPVTYWVDRHDVLADWPDNFSMECGFNLVIPHRPETRWTLQLTLDDGHTRCAKLPRPGPRIKRDSRTRLRAGISEALYDASSHTTHIRGWCFANGHSVAEVTLTTDAGGVSSSPVNLNRQDVHAKYRDCHQPNCGFMATVPTDRAPATLHLQPHSDSGALPTTSFELSPGIFEDVRETWTPGNDPAIRSHRFNSGMPLTSPTVAVVSHIPALPAVQGNRVVMVQLLQRIRDLGMRPVLIMTHPPGDPPHVEAYADIVDELHVIFSHRLQHIGRPQVCPADRGHPLVEHMLAYLTRTTDLHAAIANYAHMASSLRSLPSGVRKLVVTHDVLHRLQHLGIPLPAFRRCSEAEEATLLKYADTIVAINDVERAMLANLVPEREVIECSLACDGITPCPPESNDSNEGGTVLFVGSGNPLNVNGLEAFIREGWPLVKQHLPNATLKVAGSVSEALSDEATSTVGVMCLGVVDDLRSAYESADVVINCTTLGTGLKIKCLEAMAYGRALVTTSNGAEGIRGVPGSDYLVVDGWTSFANEVTSVLQSPSTRQSLAASGRALIEREYTMDSVFSELDRALSIGQMQSENALAE